MCTHIVCRILEEMDAWFSWQNNGGLFPGAIASVGCLTYPVKVRQMFDKQFQSLADGLPRAKTHVQGTVTQKRCNNSLTGITRKMNLRSSIN